MMTEKPRVRIERGERFLILTLDRPERRNALDGAMLDGLEAALDVAAADTDRVALVLTGAPPVFCAGADLKERLADPLVRVARMHALVLRLTEMPLLTIAAIDGPAMGGGLELALACDLRIASPGARMGLPEIGMGVFPAYGGTQLLPHRIGLSAAIHMIVGGESVDAETALHMGLVDEVAADDALTAARALCARYADRNPLAVGAALKAMRSGKRAQLESGLPVERQALKTLLLGRIGPKLH